MDVDDALQDFRILEYDKPDFDEHLQPLFNHFSLQGQQDSSLDAGKLDCDLLLS
jgi:hypothetical protein